MNNDCKAEQDLILVTGASGKTGRAVIKALLEKQACVRAFVRNAQAGEHLKDLGVNEVVLGDLNQEEDLRRACKGVKTIYHIPPNMCADEVSIAKKLLNAAKANDVWRLVYHSVLHPQVEAMPHHWQKMRVEEKIFESGLSYTILQPAAYMQNILAYWQVITQNGIYRVPYAPTTRLGMVDLLDVAEAASKVMMEDRHSDAIYELAGAECLTQIEVAQVLSEELGREVKAEKLDLAEWEKQARINGLGEYALETLKKMFVYYEQFAFVETAMYWVGY
jgi:uncharacterized protein YbjT (DUF2867 family)